MADLGTDYLGYRLRSPFVPSSSPVTGDLDGLRRLEDAGAGAVVLPSLFEERLGRDAREAYREGSVAAETYSAPTRPSPEFGPYSLGSEGYLRFATQAKASISVPVIASLNGVSGSGWGWYAAELEATGVDALEVNVHDVIAAPATTAAEVEARYVEIVRTVRAATRLPIAVKLGMSFTALPNLVDRLVEAGAAGLVLFNRFYDPDIDLDSRRLVSRLALSDPRELGSRLRWLGILRPQVQASLAATGGVHSGNDAVKALLAGADVVMMASALVQHGAGHLATVEADVSHWMDEHRYGTVDELRGAMSRPRVGDPSAYERSVYEETLASFERRPEPTRH
jgi:dihydroorotate dehydrogenase (fumarate)